VSVSVQALSVLRDVLNGRIVSLLNRPNLPVETVREVVSYGRSAMEHHLERRIRSSSLFEAPRV
jgi:hypothetical protein